MLKIKDNIELKKLEKYGFKKEDGDYYLDFVPYNENDNTGCSYIRVCGCDNDIEFDSVDGEDVNKAAEVLYNLIQAGLVEKV